MVGRTSSEKILRYTENTTPNNDNDSQLPRQDNATCSLHYFRRSPKRLHTDILTANCYINLQLSTENNLMSLLICSIGTGAQNSHSLLTLCRFPCVLSSPTRFLSQQMKELPGRERSTSKSRRAGATELRTPEYLKQHQVD